MYRRSQRWMLIINNRFLSLYDYNFLLVIEKIRKRNSKICGSRIPNVNRFVFTRNSLSNGLLIQINVVNLRSEKRKTVFGFKLMPVDVFSFNGSIKTISDVFLGYRNLVHRWWNYILNRYKSWEVNERKSQRKGNEERDQREEI